jgi:hypothetical protein
VQNRSSEAFGRPGDDTRLAFEPHVTSIWIELRRCRPRARFGSRRSRAARVSCVAVCAGSIFAAVTTNDDGDPILSELRTSDGSTRRTWGCFNADLGETLRATSFARSNPGQDFLSNPTQRQEKRLFSCHESRAI